MDRLQVRDIESAVLLGTPFVNENTEIVFAPAGRPASEEAALPAQPSFRADVVVRSARMLGRFEQIVVSVGIGHLFLRSVGGNEEAVRYHRDGA